MHEFARSSSGSPEVVRITNYAAQYKLSTSRPSCCVFTTHILTNIAETQNIISPIYTKACLLKGVLVLTNPATATSANANFS